MTNTPPARPNPPLARNERLRRAAFGAAVATGVTSLVILALMIAGFVQTRNADPLQATTLDTLKEQLRARPENGKLTDDVRALDLLVRKSYFAGREFLRVGTFLLLGSIAGLLVSLRVLAAARRTTPRPAKYPVPDNSLREGRLARRLVAAAGLILAAAALMAAWRLSPSPSSISANPESRIPRPANAPGSHETMKRWPSFRGPGGIGVAGAARAPLEWNGPTRKNILWKSPVPKPGTNSPIVWGDKVFLSGADDASMEAFCFDAATGKLLWRNAVTPAASGERPNVSGDTGHAAPTMATDGRRVFVMFSTSDIACLDFSGKTVWTAFMGAPDNAYGHASSLIAHGGRLIVQFDRAGLGLLAAIDTATGKILWETPREVENSWGSPIVVDTEAGTEIITTANPFVMGFDPVTGRELWRVSCLSGDVAPSPAFGGGRVFAANAGACLAAIRPGNSPEILWKTEDDLPDVASPVATCDLVFMCTSGGTVTCRDTADGTLRWRQEFPNGFYASPVIAGDRVYAVDRAGVTHIFKAAGKYGKLEESPLGEPAVATPAFAHDGIYIRGEKNLYFIHE
ncbi:MAG: PQQ-binding-like beta-propeller repeat protein [Planctomycetota bacterium]